jgi:CheY-like chemotaxis protein
LAAALLKRQGYAVTQVGNGKEAVAAASAEKFDLLLMDVQMPEMDGLKAAARIRAQEEQTGTHLPIIAMTAQGLEGGRQRCLEAGMDSYLAKPIHAEVLFGAIDALLTPRYTTEAVQEETTLAHRHSRANNDCRHAFRQEDPGPKTHSADSEALHARLKVEIEQVITILSDYLGGA